MHLGAGWKLAHLTDRSILLTKDDVGYRRVVGRDGYVLLRLEPGMNRADAIDRAVDLARKNDAALAEIVAKQIVPKNVGPYQRRQRRFANGAFATPEDPAIIGVKRP